MDGVRSRQGKPRHQAGPGWLRKGGSGKAKRPSRDTLPLGGLACGYQMAFLQAPGRIPEGGFQSRPSVLT